MKKRHFYLIFRMIDFPLGGALWIPKSSVISQKGRWKRVTDSQRKAIRQMRLKGLGYCHIGSLIGLNEKNVRAYCKSHGLAGDGDLVRLNYPVWCRQNSRCPICGTKIDQPKIGRKKKFCSGRCRTRYFRENHETEREHDTN